MASIDCCNNLTNPSAGFNNVVDNGDGTFTGNFTMTSPESGGANACGSGTHISISKSNGTFIGGFTFLEGQDLAVDTPTESSASWSDFQPFFSGIISDGSAFTVDTIGLCQSIGGFDASGTCSITISISTLDCTTNELSNNVDNTTTITVTILPPVARLSNEVCVGGASGVVTFDQELKENDGVTNLSSPDLVRYTIKDGSTVLEVVEGVYGADISTFTQTSGTVVSSITNHSTGLVVDGGTINFARKDWAISNNFVSNETQDTSISDLTICIEAYDNDQASWNDNIDNVLILQDFYYSNRYVFNNRYTSGLNNGTQSVLGHRIASFLNSGDTSLLTNIPTDMISWYNATSTAYLNQANNNDPNGSFIATGTTPPFIGVVQNTMVADLAGAPHNYLNGGGIDETAIGQLGSTFIQRYGVAPGIEIVSITDSGLTYNECTNDLTLGFYFRDHPTLTVPFTAGTYQVIKGGTLSVPTTPSPIISPFVVSGQTVLASQNIIPNVSSAVTGAFNNNVTFNNLREFGNLGVYFEFTRQDGAVMNWLLRVEMSKY